MQSGLDADGHPHGGEVLPSIRLPRRMFVGRRTRFLAPILIGETVSHISSIVPKQGRGGRMVFANLRHGIAPAGLDAEAVVEEQDLICRDVPGPAAEAVPPGTPSVQATAASDAHVPVAPLPAIDAPAQDGARIPPGARRVRFRPWALDDKDRIMVEATAEGPA